MVQVRKVNVKKALITGITGQDGSYLSDLLLEQRYEVHGIVRRVAIEDPEHRLWRIRHIIDKLVLHSASLESFASVFSVVDKVQPDEIYHLAAQSFVSYSFEDEFSTIGTNINGTHYVLAAMKERAPRARFYFAASSEMYGNAKETPQDENTAFHPRSPYGISKVAGFQLTENYRQAYNLYAVSGNNNAVQRFNGTNGTFISTFVPNGVGSLNLPIGIVIGPDGNFYVASFNNNKVARFSAADGTYLGDFVSAASNGGLSGPNFMVFRPLANRELLPTLSISLSATNVLLAWPTNSTGFTLEQSLALASNGNWIPVTSNVVVVSGSNVATLPRGEENRFFRLAKP